MARLTRSSNSTATATAIASTTARTSQPTGQENEEPFTPFSLPDSALPSFAFPPPAQTASADPSTASCSTQPVETVTDQTSSAPSNDQNMDETAPPTGNPETEETETPLTDAEESLNNMSIDGEEREEEALPASNSTSTPILPAVFTKPTFPASAVFANWPAQQNPRVLKTREETLQYTRTHLAGCFPEIRNEILSLFNDVVAPIATDPDISLELLQTTISETIVPALMPKGRALQEAVLARAKEEQDRRKRKIDGLQQSVQNHIAQRFQALMETTSTLARSTSSTTLASSSRPPKMAKQSSLHTPFILPAAPVFRSDARREELDSDDDFLPPAVKSSSSSSRTVSMKNPWNGSLTFAGGFPLWRQDFLQKLDVARIDQNDHSLALSVLRENVTIAVRPYTFQHAITDRVCKTVHDALDSLQSHWSPAGVNTEAAFTQRLQDLAKRNTETLSQFADRCTGLAAEYFAAQGWSYDNAAHVELLTEWKNRFLLPAFLQGVPHCDARYAKMFGHNDVSYIIAVNRARKIDQRLAVTTGTYAAAATATEANRSLPQNTPPRQSNPPSGEPKKLRAHQKNPSNTANCALGDPCPHFRCALWHPTSRALRFDSVTHTLLPAFAAAQPGPARPATGPNAAIIQDRPVYPVCHGCGRTNHPHQRCFTLHPERIRNRPQNVPDNARPAQ